MSKRHTRRVEWFDEKEEKKEKVKKFLTYVVCFFLFLGLLTYIGNVFKTAIVAAYNGIVGGGEVITTTNYCSFKQTVFHADWVRLLIKAILMSGLLIGLENEGFKATRFIGGILSFVYLFAFFEVLEWAAYLIKFLFAAAWIGITTFKWQITIKNILMDYNIDFISRVGQVSLIYGLLKVFLSSDEEREK